MVWTGRSVTRLNIRTGLSLSRVQPYIHSESTRHGYPRGFNITHTDLLFSSKLARVPVDRKLLILCF